MKRIVTSLLFSLLIIGCGTGESSEIPKGTAPDFSLTTHTGETFTLSDHTGSVVVVNFWATWCQPCRAEIPEFIELQNEYGDEGLQFVGVSVDREGFDVVRPFAEEMNINYPLVIAEESVAQKYGGIPAIPTTFIIDRNGQIEDYIIGQTNKTQLLNIIEPMLDISRETAASAPSEQG